MSLIEFAQTKLKIDCWSKMIEIFEAVESGERKILIRSCNGAGKTTALAAICNWYFTTYKDSIVLTTASSWNQVKRNLWGEIRRQARQAKLYKDKKLRISDTSIMLTEKHFMIGISPNIPENAMGFHAPHILVAIDEATGVDREIITALTGNLTGAHAQIVMICNPIDRDTYAFEAERSGQWKVIEISAFDHPNVKGETETIHGAVTREWIVDRLRSWSEEVRANIVEASKTVYVWWLKTWFRRNPLVDARILGEWAQLEASGFIPLELIRAHVRSREGVQRSEWDAIPPLPESAPKVRALGIDISRGLGRDATVYSRFEVLPDAPDIQLLFQSFYDEDLMATADRIRNEYEECEREGIELVIALDDTGLGGGVSDRLKQLGIPHFAINANHKPKGFFADKIMANARAEMYFLLKSELQEGKILLQDYGRFHAELSAIRLDVSKTNGTYKMEDKSLTKQRLGRSPDYADATALARYGLRLRQAKKSARFL